MLGRRCLVLSSGARRLRVDDAFVPELPAVVALVTGRTMTTGLPGLTAFSPPSAGLIGPWVRC